MTGPLSTGSNIAPNLDPAPQKIGQKWPKSSADRLNKAKNDPNPDPETNKWPKTQARPPN